MNARLPAAGLGRTVRRARKDAGLTISELARRARVGRKFLHELEAGKETPRTDKVTAVLAVLGLELSATPARAASGARRWLSRNRAALRAYNEHVEKHGVFSEGLRSF
jgi:transcriptional regulator with XRE-family HTH domain